MQDRFTRMSTQAVERGLFAKQLGRRRVGAGVRIPPPPLNTTIMDNIENINHCCGGNLLQFTIIADGWKLTSRSVKSDTFLNREQVERQCKNIAESVVEKFSGRNFKYVLVRLTLSYYDSHSIMKWEDFVGNADKCVSDIVNKL